MKTKQIFLSVISILIASLTSGYAQKPEPFSPIQLKETGIISHLMMVKQTSEYRTAFFIKKWETIASDLKTQLDDALKKSNIKRVDTLKNKIDSIQNSIDSISVSYTRLQIAYDRIILQLDYVISSRNKVLFIKRLNRKIRNHNNIRVMPVKGTSQMKLFIDNLKTCYSEFEIFETNILNRDSALTQQTQREKTEIGSDPANFTDPITAGLGIIETGIGIYTSIDESNGKRVANISKLLQACRFKSVAEFLTAEKKDDDDEKD
jgi:hypothetical protein